MQIAFIVATPLQIIICMAIILQLESEKSIDVMVVGYFNDAAGVCERINSKFGKKINYIYCDEYLQAVQYVGSNTYSRIFIHWDVGVRTSIYINKLLKKSTRAAISVFEEGIGTYRDDIYKGAKKTMLKALGFPVNLGGSRKTKNIYVYSPLEYIRKVTKTPREVLQIKYTVDLMLNSYAKEFSAVFDPGNFLSEVCSQGKDECLIYMSSWKFDASALSCYEEYNAVKVLKLHPHIIEVPDLYPYKFLFCPACVPAEILIKKASKHFAKVTVIHHGSSVTRYATADNVIYKIMRQ